MFPKNIAKKIVKQSYGAPPQIAGVKLIELAEYVDDSGSFVELGRLEKGACKFLPDFEFKQINYSCVLPGTIKATHIHKKQDDVWFVPPQSRLLVGLKDLRAGSKTEGSVMRFVLGAGKARLLFIPAGVAHGLANPWNEPAAIFYFTNYHFSKDSDKSEEYRLPADFFGKDFWKMRQE